MGYFHRTIVTSLFSILFSYNFGIPRMILFDLICHGSTLCWKRIWWKLVISNTAGSFSKISFKLKRNNAKSNFIFNFGPRNVANGIRGKAGFSHSSNDSENKSKIGSMYASARRHPSWFFFFRNIPKPKWGVAKFLYGLCSNFRKRVPQIFFQFLCTAFPFTALSKDYQRSGVVRYLILSIPVLWASAQPHLLANTPNAKQLHIQTPSPSWSGRSLDPLELFIWLFSIPPTFSKIKWQIWKWLFSKMPSTYVFTYVTQPLLIIHNFFKLTAFFENISKGGKMFLPHFDHPNFVNNLSHLAWLTLSNAYYLPTDFGG